MGRDVALTLFRHGQALENAGRLEEAIATYDRALDSLRDSPDAHQPIGLVWMNRGNTAQKLASQHAATPARATEALGLAVASYDAAIAAFQQLPLDTPEFRNHLGAAWLNRGHALIFVSPADAASSFRQAAAELAQLPLAADPSYPLNLAGAHTNLAHILLDSEPAAAADAARHALEVLEPLERAHEAFAGLSLRARRALVMALGTQLTAAEAAGQPLNALASEATDAVDDGLALARELEEHGFSHHRPLAQRLFRLGTQLYGRHQPHFLGEFVLESLSLPPFAADAEFRALADVALREALTALQHAPVPENPERALAAIRSLREAQQQIATFPPLPGTPVAT